MRIFSKDRRCHAGNFKQWGEVVFSNRNNMDENIILARIEDSLIERVYFVAQQVDLPDVRFDEHYVQLDHDWHEFHSIQLTNSPVSDLKNRDISTFITALQETHGNRTG